MKKLMLLMTAAIGLLAGYSPSANAQAVVGPKLTALSKPNPAQAITTIFWSYADLGDDQLAINFVVEGIGFWSCYLQCYGERDICMVPWTRSTGHPTLVSMTVRKSTFLGCYCNLENVHGLPPLFGPYKNTGH